MNFWKFWNSSNETTIDGYLEISKNELGMIYSKICLNQTRLCEKQPLADFLKKNIKKLFLQSESKEIAKSKKIA